MSKPAAITSSFITGLRYSEERRELTVEIGSRTYTYAGVSRRVRDKVRYAESVGAAYGKLIKGRYPVRHG